jgi:hypothetical protein
MASIPELTRLLAAIHTWQEGHGKPGVAGDNYDERCTSTRMSG